LNIGLILLINMDPLMAICMGVATLLAVVILVVIIIFKDKNPPEN